jgi:hypothetical protein
MNWKRVALLSGLPVLVASGLLWLAWPRASPPLPCVQNFMNSHPMRLSNVGSGGGTPVIFSAEQIYVIRRPSCAGQPLAVCEWNHTERPRCMVSGENGIYVIDYWPNSRGASASPHQG